MLSHILIVLAVIAVLFHKPLLRLLQKRLPDRERRHQVVGVIITAFVLVIVVRLLALFW